VASQRPCGCHIATRCATDPKIDPVGEKRGKGSELFRDDKRRVVRQHDATRTDAHALCRRGHMTDDDRRRRAGDAGHVVVLGEPVAVIAQTLCLFCQIDSVGKRFGCGFPFGNRRKIEK
jgi:hypothetical protein